MPRKPTIPIEVQDEWMFPGAGYVNGTVEDAMKAGTAAYPM